jgi:predicted dehydrogenase
VRLAFIGGYGHHYLKGLLRDPQGAEVKLPVAVASDGVDAPRAKQFGESLKSSFDFFDDPAAMLARAEPDSTIVSLGSVYAYAGDLIAMAMERGFAVVSDKPIASSRQQLDRLRELAARPGAKPLITEFDFRARPHFLAARDAVRKGEVGTVVLASAQKSYRFGPSRPAWYADRARYTGTLMWVLSHGIDVIRFSTGLEIRRAVGRGGNLSQPAYGSMEDHVAVLFELERGATALAHADYLRPAAAATHGDDRLRIAGSKGVVEVRDGRCKLITAENAEADITDRFANAKPVYQAMLDAALARDDSLYSTAESLASAHVILAAREAADRGEWVAM